MKTVSVRHVAPAFRTYAGACALDALAKELSRTGAERVVIVHGRSMNTHRDALALVESAVGGRLAGRFGEAREHSPIASVLEAAALLDEVRADAVVAVGGGSAIVTSRAAVILSAEGAPVSELATRRESGRLVSPRLDAPKVTQWIVPSTPTTAYAKAGAAVRDLSTGERFALFDPKARAAGVFMHPDLASTAPAAVVRGAALNAFAMAVDGLQSGSDDPLAEAQLRHSLHMTATWLPRLGVRVDGDVGVRLMLSSLLAGQASDHVGTGLAQPISHALGPLSTTSNGVVEAIMLPYVMRFNAGVTDLGMEGVAQSLNPAAGPGAGAAIAAVESLLRACGVPSRLRDVGVEKAAMDSAIQHVSGDWASTTVPKRADEQQLRSLLEAAW